MARYPADGRIILEARSDGSVYTEAAGEEAGLLLRAHFEDNVNNIITVGTPAGYTAGADTTWALTNASYAAPAGGAYDGTYAIYSSSTTERYAAIGITTNDIFSSTEGRVVLYAYADVADDGGTLWRVQIDAENNIFVQITESNNLVFRHASTSAGDVTVVSTGGYFTTGTWHKVTARWRVTGSPHLSLQIDDQTPATETTAIAAFTGSPTTFEVLGHSAGAGSMRGYIDYLRIYNAYE